MDKRFRFFCAIFLFFGISGCSSVLTYLGPVKTEIVDGEISKGKFIRFDYELTAAGDRLHITKSRMCEKIVQKMAVSKKENRGFSFALLEMPLFGLGLFDLYRSYAIVEESRKVEPRDKYVARGFMPCNGEIPAANELFMIRDNARGLNIKAESDAKGVIDLKEVLSGGIEAAGLEIWPAENPDDVMIHAYPAETFSP